MLFLEKLMARSCSTSLTCNKLEPTIERGGIVVDELTMSKRIYKSAMEQRAREKQEQQRLFHQAVREGKISAIDAVKSASFFPAEQRPRLVSKPSF